ncbi:ATP-dependent DNA helicase PIF1-like [Exaiptasia diaphana]|uniref:ATP-dependent DNA helicase PIF1 n=1 Tax=Exaiptasia diaphana TaxID=2652724 RepID=A0A913YMB4_EXADI|nr:ATP-dependent DNA helicase PIF1-like [Exaiptasia diaphana]
MRQKNDQAFTALLNRFRTATQTDEDIEAIQSRQISPTDINYPSDALHIWAENKPVDEHNRMKLEQIPKPMFTVRASDLYPTNVTKQDIDRVLSRGRSETGGLDYKFHLKETARVMLTSNIDIADRLINGQIGTVFKIDSNPNTQNPSIIYVKFDDNKAGENKINNSNNQYAKQHKVVPLEPILVKIKVRPNKPSSPEIQRVQFPLTLAWACTVHKTQGLTLDRVVISFDLNRQKNFNYGQIYVALSRAKTLQGIHILGKIEHKHVKANAKTSDEYERLRKDFNKLGIHECNQEQSFCSTKSLVITLLNIRSLNKHSIDIKYDSAVFNSDVLALTETQLLPNTNGGRFFLPLENYLNKGLGHSPESRMIPLNMVTVNNKAIKQRLQKHAYHAESYKYPREY